MSIQTEKLQEILDEMRERENYKSKAKKFDSEEEAILYAQKIATLKPGDVFRDENGNKGVFVEWDKEDGTILYLVPNDEKILMTGNISAALVTAID